MLDVFKRALLLIKDEALQVRLFFNSEASGMFILFSGCGTLETMVRKRNPSSTFFQSALRPRCRPPPHLPPPPHLSSTSPFASSLSKAASLLAPRCFSPQAALFRFFPSCPPSASVFGPFPAPCALSVSHLFALRVTSGLL